MDYTIQSLIFRSGIPVEIELELRKRILGEYEL